MGKCSVFLIKYNLLFTPREWGDYMKNEREIENENE